MSGVWTTNYEHNLSEEAKEVRAFLKASANGGIQFNGPREQDIVLQVNVLVEVVLEFFQAVVERVKSRAGVGRRGEIPAESADFGKKSSCRIVLLRHHCDWIGHRPEATVWFGRSNGDGFLQTSDIGEQNRLLLRQMMRKFFVELRERCRDYRQFCLR